MSPRFVLGQENVPCVAEVVNRSLKADCTDFTQFHIMRTYNHRRSSDKIWAQEGRLFRQNVVTFPTFSPVIMNFFSPIRLVSFIDPLHQKLAKA